MLVDRRVEGRGDAEVLRRVAAGLGHGQAPSPQTTVDQVDNVRRRVVAEGACLGCDALPVDSLLNKVLGTLRSKPLKHDSR